MGIDIKYTQSGYEIRFKYNEAIVESIKTIKGSYWNSKGRFWHVPAYMEAAIEALKRKYGIMTDPVIEMPEQVIPIEDLPELMIPLYVVREPYPFQGKGVARGLQLESFINGDAPGLGKTTQAICTAVARKSKCILIICPNSLKLNWQLEWQIVAGKRSMILSDKTKTSWVNYHKVGMFDVFIVNYESLKKYFVQPGWQKPKVKGSAFKLNQIPFKECIDMFDEVIVDESHNCKDGTRLQSKLVMGICKGKKNVQLLTGTPVVNMPFDLISQLSIINKLRKMVEHIPLPVNNKGQQYDFSGYERFMLRYCGGTERGASNLKELQGRLYRYCFFRREKKDVLVDLPDKIRQILPCEITNAAEYQKAENNFVTYLKEIKLCTDEEVAKKLRGEMMVKIGVLKQIAARGKIEGAVEHINEVINGGQKIVVFYHHNEILAELKKIFPHAVTISGSDSNEERERNKKRFQEDPNVNIIFCSLKAGGVGHTLTAASEVLLIEIPWTDALVEQAIDRLHRIGQWLKVRAAILLGKNTIDYYCYHIVENKRNIFVQVTGDKYTAQDEVVDDLLNFFDRRIKDLEAA